MSLGCEGTPCTRVGAAMPSARKPKAAQRPEKEKRGQKLPILNCGRHFERGQSVCRASELELMEFRAFTPLP